MTLSFLPKIILGISQSLNFTIEFYESDDSASEQWGMKRENNTYTGLIGEMVCINETWIRIEYRKPKNCKIHKVEGVAQIALGDLYYIPYFLDVMDLSIPYTAQCLTFLTPEALTDNSWQTLVLPFRHVRFCYGIRFIIISNCSLFFSSLF